MQIMFYCIICLVLCSAYIYIYKHVLALYAPLTALGNIEGTNSEKICV